MRYFLEIAYDGAAFHGWQRQINAVSIQQVLEEAMTTVLRTKVEVMGCGRTDTGVHATQYFLHFDYDEIDDRFVFSLNGVLPAQIAVLAIHQVAEECHARFDATSRSYEYRIHQRKDPFSVGRSTPIYQELDFEAMQEAAKFLIGQLDFASFCKAGSDVKTTICDVRKAEWKKTESGLVFEITADRFLRNMVRAIVGTLVEVGKGKLSLSDVQRIMEAHDRKAAGSSASADGLYLTRVEYPFL